MRLRYVALVAVVALALGGAVGRFALPPRVETEERIVERVVTVERTRVVTEVKEALRWRTKTIVVEAPDGTKTTTTDTTAAKDTDNTTHSDSDTRRDTDTERVGRKVVDPGRTSQWRVGVLAGAAPLDAPGRLGVLHLGLHAERRLIGPLWVGVMGHTNATSFFVGGSLTLEF